MKEVYVVDDDAGIVTLLTMVLEMAGFTVRAALDPAIVLAWIVGGGRPSLIITDYEMPSMTGSRLAKTVRANGYAGPVLCVSAHVFDAPPSGINQVVSKPLDIDELRSAVARLATRNGS